MYVEHRQQIATNKLIAIQVNIKRYLIHIKIRLIKRKINWNKHFCYHLEIYEKIVSNCSVLCDSGTKAVQKVRCLKDDNGTSCAHVGFDLRKCFVDDESCPGIYASILHDILTFSNLTKSNLTSIVFLLI